MRGRYKYDIIASLFHVIPNVIPHVNEILSQVLFRDSFIYLLSLHVCNILQLQHQPRIIWPETRILSSFWLFFLGFRH